MVFMIYIKLCSELAQTKLFKRFKTDNITI